MTAGPSGPAGKTDPNRGGQLDKNEAETFIPEVPTPSRTCQ
jgi:hypothetical protein